LRIADFFVGADFFRGAPFRVGGLRPSLTAVISILPGCFQRMSSRFAADSRLEGTRFEPSVPLRRATLIETPPSNSAIPPQRAKPVPSEQEPPVPCVSAPNQDPIGKDDNVLILIRIGLDGGVPIGTPRSFQFSASYQYDGLRPLGSRFGAETHPNGELPSDPSTDRLTTTDQTPKLCKKPCRSSSSLRVLRRQGAAKHKRR
jgi:hypothetical protein